MVEIDIRQHGDVGVNDVRRVPGAAEANFNDTHVHAFVREVQKRRHRQEFKAREDDSRNGLNVRKPFEDTDERLIVDGLSVNRDALVH